MDSIWVEKHRPSNLDDFVGNEAAIKVMKGFVESGKLMHLMLAGPPGVGKTSSLHCVARALLGEHYRKGLLELNAADERGIDVVREKIKNFAKERVDLPNGQAKIILLDEADSMLDAAQQALRRLMESYSETTRFAFACNQSDKVIDAVQSRCCVIRFSKISDEQMRMKLESICQKENVPYESEALQVVIDSAEGDMRKAIGALQAASAAYGKIENETIYRACDVPPGQQIANIVESCNKGLWRPAHEEVANLLREGYTSVDVLKAMKNAINNLKIAEIQRVQFLKEVSYVFCQPDRHRINLLQLDKLICRLCLLKTTPVSV
eukprot:Gregarina_sp_Pseudo_9__1617@NODE_208_length_3611_cov_31_945969_g193_i0_p2_GENE_NODE_208_length_3611_cov_31_945969_g193_i0NODE_208_length_3611_cov_31_945969_g193_i0_p2_ORF_typecomplete_len322_score23_30DNA_pol3_delta2/PF13177_6/7_7e30RuvB_N/PF05496_12/6_2e15AAA/PF00004_29/1_3e13Rad17/PF03215_15/1_1e10DNA_pol3_delta/PF06144_13/1_4e08Bac_DnaA/PF00308_18/1_7e08Rep_fac_C/PF08542_11/1_5e07AAA_3/PF07726_11/2_5e07AAA_22/PF13401_6/6_5e06AAA_14/PF13173_6/6_5e06AAA_14/PF13173_6/2_8e03AAA_5/PF07728_14/2_7e0